MNTDYSSVLTPATFSSIACVIQCDTCTDGVHTCSNCADGYAMKAVCTGKKKKWLKLLKG